MTADSTSFVAAATVGRPARSRHVAAPGWPDFDPIEVQVQQDFPDVIHYVDKEDRVITQEEKRGETGRASLEEDMASKRKRGRKGINTTLQQNQEGKEVENKSSGKEATPREVEYKNEVEKEFQLLRGKKQQEVILCWNVRGLNGLNKQWEVRNMADKYKLNIMGILETKVRKSKEEDVRNKVLKSWGFYSNVEHHPLGRIWVLWNKKKLVVHIMDSFDQAIHMKVRRIEDSDYDYITFVYAFNDNGVMNALDLRYNIGSDEEFMRAIQGMAGGKHRKKWITAWATCRNGPINGYKECSGSVGRHGNTIGPSHTGGPKLEFGP
ncbi:hypothetical protein DM860_015128 [Cuscuta australis]|uniref:Endonuclease/exonuclease/phosphatase domain-containing protein n=1 Tax=Cuscuta australis TaxID=267555 RepID=A0A328DFE0_9ASTE|nr:hypothetical protein DM860_015128 [Cuscuta australis]